jgi:hypothetical protein
MKHVFKIRIVLRQANRIGTRARELRRDLRDHVRSESFRIRQAEKRARGLRLYAAWSRSHHSVATHEALPAWEPAESLA